MFTNPFTPIFGGKPDFFFGRKSILQRFDLAMVDYGSEDRALFLTGTRRSGKTALLEQLSTRAARRGRIVIDLGPNDTVAQLVRKLVQTDETTTTVSPQASVSIMGIGGGISAESISKTKRYGRENLQDAFLTACERTERGVFITIDEVQKIPIEDVSAICNAFQMASRKGHDVMLAVAGLPYAHGKAIHHEGCTYLRRATHEEISLFSWYEAKEAFASAFERTGGITIGPDELDALNRASFGHPYLIQLLGYYLVTSINDKERSGTYTITTNDVREVLPLARTAYERRALQPLIDELSPREIDYLKAMSVCLSEDRLAKVSDVARELDKDIRQLSGVRAKLIDNGIVASPQRGYLMFCIPYLADYVTSPDAPNSALETIRQRRL